jgi:hypothetical protein
MAEPRIILLERIEKEGGKSFDWWKENMPAGAKYEPDYQYRKRGLKYFDIKSVIQLANVKDECMILCYDGEEIIVQGTFAELYEKWIELGEFEDDENSYS